MSNVAQFIIAAILGSFGIGGETTGVNTTGKMETVVELTPCEKKMQNGTDLKELNLNYPCRNHDPFQDC